MKYVYPLHAIHVSQQAYALKSIDEVLRFIRTCGQWSDKRKTFTQPEIYLDRWTNGVILNEWIVRDDWGRTVYCSDFWDLYYKKYRHVGYVERRRKKILNAMRLGLPIPHVRKRKRHKSYTGKGLGEKQYMIEHGRRRDKW
jgi:hypothetical protein